MVVKHADVVIVGVGAAGAILARELAEAGFEVLGIDKGPYYHSDDFWLKFDELRYSVRGGLSPTMDTDPVTWRPNAQTPAQILPWAVGPQPLNPLWLPPSVGVGGGSIPFPPLRPSAANQLFVDACKELGYHPFPAPAAIISEDWGERKACVYCGFCRDYACHVGAKTTTLDTMMPKALATGNLKLLTNCRVQRVNVDAEGLARSVSYIDAKGERHEATGDLIILSAYSLENTRLMLVSGLNQNGMVGKRFTIHNYGWFSGTLPEETHVYAGPAVAGFAIDDTNPYAEDRDEVDFLGGTPIMFFGGDTQPIEAATLLMPPDAPLWGEGY